MNAVSWINFVRQYAPVPRNDSMYDETIQRSARRAGIEPFLFEHPAQGQLLTCFNRETADPFSVILTGTAGDGKTHLCRQVWSRLGGDPNAWASDNPYLTLKSLYPKDRSTWSSSHNPTSYREVIIHFIRDLSAWAPQQGVPWEPEKESLLQNLCRALFDPNANEVFLIAANDGQLIECWRRLSDTEHVIRARKIFEELLVEDQQELAGVRLRMFNLSRWNSADLFERAYKAFIEHPGWQSCYEDAAGEDEAFGPKCPIRHNFELLKTPLVYNRLHSLIELCDHNGLHLPIRQLLLLLSNAVFGCVWEKCQDRLMKPADVPQVIRAGMVSQCSLYNNIFGGNLSDNRRQSMTIFDYLDRFQIGYETCNRIDNILIFGEGDPELGKYFTSLIQNDPFYGADERYFAARNRYIEGAEDDANESKDFLDLLVAQRRGLFFKIPEELEGELRLWELTVFRFAGEYLSEVVTVLRSNGTIKRPILNRLIKGLNRIFTGMLINSERELYLATSGNFSQAKISRVLVDRISVEPRHGERVLLSVNAGGRIQLTVHFSKDVQESLELNLVRYEFLSRVAIEGALPASFSKECYEDTLAFKSRLLAGYERRRKEEGGPETSPGLRLLNVSQQGLPEDRYVEVLS
jgi:hypothetical protein